MEPRILYSADLGAAMVATANHAAGVEQRSLDAAGEYRQQDSVGNAAALYGQAALSFEANLGQGGSGADFIARGIGYGIALSQGDAYLTLGTGADARVVHLSLQGASGASAAEAGQLLTARSNYMVGGDPSNWRTDIANYADVTYRRVYDGIDLRYYGTQRQLEYDFTVAAGADASQVRLRFDGIESASIDGAGNLVLQLDGAGSLIAFQAPVSYQQGANGREAVASRYEIAADGSIGFVLGEYDHSRELVIDPVLGYASYFGTAGAETGLGVAVDAAGAVYVTGRTTNALGTNLGAGGGGDVYVAKFSADLSTLIYTTRVGGTGDEQGNAIAVDSTGAVSVTGWTKSTNFPLASASDSTRGGNQDAFVFRLNPAGNALTFSTYLGDAGDTDSGKAIAVDASGNVYVTGEIRTVVLFALSDENAFVAKYSSAGAVQYLYTHGGGGEDYGTGIAVDAAGNAYIVGNTKSNDLPTVNAHDTTRQGDEGFLAKVNAAGNALLYSTYIGGNKKDGAAAVAIDGTGKAYVTGSTDAKNAGEFQVTAGAFQTGSTDDKDSGYVRVYNTNLSGAASLVYSSFLGGSSGPGPGQADTPSGIAVDAQGRIYVVGTTDSPDFPVTPDAYDSSNAGGGSIFLTVLNAAGGGASDLVYGTFFGTAVGTGNVVAAGGRAVFVGTTNTDSLSTPGAAQPARAGGSDAIAVSFTIQANSAPTSLAPAAVTTAEDTVRTFTGVDALSVADVDGGNLSVTLSVTNGTLSLLTVTGLSFGAGDGTADAAMTFSGSQANLNAALATLRYAPAANFNGAASLNFSVSDGAAAAVAKTVAITVTAVNDGPTATNLSAAQTYTEDTPLNLTDIVVSDIDSASVTATLTLSNVAAGSLSTATAGAVTSTYNAATGVWTASGAIADVNALLAGVIFTPTSNFNSNFSIATSVSDGVLAVTGTKNIAGTAVNDAPTSAAPAAVTTAEDQTRTFTGVDALSVSDVDGGNLSVTLSVTNGTLSLGTVAGLTFGSGDGTADTTMTFSGSQASLNAALGTLSYAPTADFNGASSLAFSVSDGVAAAVVKNVAISVTAVADVVADAVSTNEDAAITFNAITGTNGASADNFENAGRVVTGVTQGANGTVTFLPNGNLTYTPGANFNGTDSFTYTVTSGGVTETAAVSVTIAAVNDGPTATNLSAAQGYIEDTALNLTDIVVSDIDSANVTATLTLSNVAAGSLSTATAGAVTSTYNAATGVWTASGAVASVNTLLAGVVFTPTANFNSNFSIATSVSDGALAVAGTKNITGTAINDAPASMAPASVSATEDVVFAFTGADALSVADVDGGNLSVTLGVTNGTLSLLTVTGLSFGAGDGTADATMTFSGSQANLNAALATLRYAPTADSNGSSSLSFSVSDGVAAAVAKNVAITVGAVADVVGDAVSTSEGTAITFNAITGTNGASADNFENAGRVVTGVTQGANGTVTFLPNGNLTYTPGANFNGTDSFTYTVTSGGVTETAAVSVFVTAVNDGPTATNLSAAQTYTEDTPLNLTDIVVSDIDSANVTATLTLSNVAAGSLSTATAGAVTSTYNAATGVWTASGAIADVNALLAGVIFTPTANFDGNFLIATQVSDGALSVSGNKIMIGVAVNDAPTLTGTNDLTPIAEDALSNNGTLVSSLIAGYASDPDAGSLQGIAVIGVDNSNGSWQWSRNGGATWTAFGSPSNSAARILDADAQNRVRFVPNANFAGTVSGLTFRAWDDYAGGDGTVADTSVNGGSTLYSSATATASITVVAINDAPVRSAGMVSSVGVPEDSGLTPLGLASLGYTPGGGADEAGQVLTYTVTTVPPPAAGDIVLGDGTTVVTANTSYTLAELSGMQFRTAPDAVGGPFTFAWTVRDNGGTAGGGSDFLSESLTITIGAVNDAPVRTAGTVTGLVVQEDAGTTSLGLAGLIYAPGPGADESGQSLTYRVTGVPPASLGQVLLANGTTVVTANTNYTLAQLRGMQFRASADMSGSATFTWSVIDNGGTAGGGADTLMESLLITVLDVNDQPVQAGGAINDLAVAEDSGLTGLGLGGLTYGPGGGTPEAGQMLSYTITEVPASTLGDIVLADGVTVVTVNTSYSLAQLRGMQFRAAPGSGAGSGDFEWSVRDDGGIANGGADTLVQSLHISVGAINDAPVRTGGTVLDLDVPEDSGLNGLGLGALAYGPGGGLDEATQTLTYTVTAVPAASLGHVVLADGVTVVTANTVYTLLELQGMQFRAAADASGSAMLTWSVRDSGGTAMGGSDTLLESLRITVEPVNDAPVQTGGAIGDLAVAEDSGLSSLGLGSLAYGPGGGAFEAGQSLSYTVLAVPPSTLGDVVLADGVTVVAANTAYTLGQLRGMQFRAAADASGGPAVFRWTVTDDGSTVNGGVDSLEQSLQITVSPVNDAPVLSGANPLVAIDEDESSQGTAVEDLMAGSLTDVDAGAASGIAVTAVDGTNGRWEYTRDGGQSWAYIDNPSPGAAALLAADGATRLRFVPNADWNGTVAAGVTFRAWDQSGGTAGATIGNAASGGGSSAFSAATASASITVNAVNDPVVRTAGQVANVQLASGASSVSLGLQTLAYASGPAGAADEAAQVLRYTVTGVPSPAQGTVVLADGTAVVSGTNYSLAQLRGMEFRASPGASAGTAVLAFNVTDDASVQPSTLTETISIAMAGPAPQDPGLPAPSTAPAPAPAPAPSAAPAPAAPAAPRAEGVTTGDITPLQAPTALSLAFESTAGDRSAPVAAVEEPRVLVTISDSRRPGESSEALPSDMQVSAFESKTGTAGGAELQRVLRSGAFEESLDQLREEVRREFDLDRSVTISAAGVTLGASVAYVLWLIRGGVLMSSYLSALPAWRVLDPLPVLARVDEEEDEQEDDLDAFADADSAPEATLRGY